MTDSVASAGSTGGDLPPVVRFAPESGALPPVLDSSGGEAAPVVLLIAAPEARAWAADAAFALATAWAQAGRRVVLADLDLEEPILHERAGEENVDGVADIFLYGASLARSARPVRGRGFYLIPTGTYTPDAADVFRHARWGRLVAGFREARASLLLFVPATSPELAALGRWADEAIILGETPERASAQLPEGVVIRAALLPDRAAPPPATAPEATDVAAAEEREPHPEPEGPAHEPERAPLRGDVPLTVPHPAPRSRATAQARGASPLLWGLLAAVIVAAGVYLWLAIYRPDLFENRGRGTPAAAPGSEAPAGGTAPRAAAVPAGVPLPYSIQVKAFNLLSAARQQVAVEEKRAPGTPIYITPEWRLDTVYFRVLAGLLPDTAAATALRQRLVEAGAIQAEDAAGEWSLIEFLPLTYQLGEYATPEAAKAHVDLLATHEVPAYLVALPYSDGSERWQLYSGAFHDSTSAQAMGVLLSEKGVAAKLVERTGGAVEGG